MARPLTFGFKIAAGFAATTALTLVAGGVAIVTLQSVVTDKDRLVTVYAARQMAVERTRERFASVVAERWGFLLTGESRFLETPTDFIEEPLLQGAANLEFATPDERRALDQAKKAIRGWEAAIDGVVAKRRAGAALADVVRMFDNDVIPRFKTADKELEDFFRQQGAALDRAKQRSTDNAQNATGLVIGISGAALLLAAAIALFLTRSLTRQIGSAVQHIQGSSTELQAAANQQASASGEQVSAITEVSTTLKELLTSSRQIAESAQRVSRIATETAASATEGDKVGRRAQEAIETIKRQVDRIVAHMLELGKRSQEIGGILDIIKELAEQTNILSINATIESSGAGEAGRRFGAVADEIRKLADRVTGSTREIRALIEEVRAVANTTVMTTEDGAKAVDLGTRQILEAAAAFKQIASLVGTTAEAAREIELSTKQQTTAVEQVNLAIADVAQAARETETSSRQTLETSSQLTGVSVGLAELVTANGAAGH